MPKYSVKKPFTVVVAVVMLIVLGIVSFMKMTTDLLPEISLPYLLVITTYPGASPERVEADVTEPLESSLGTVNGVENVSSTSSENYSMVILEFADDTNMDSAMVKVSTAINQIRFPELCGSPIMMEMSPDMLPTMMVSVAKEGMDIYELTDFVKEEVAPYLERQVGVANVDKTGLVDKTVEVRLDQLRIDAVNRKIVSKVTKAMDEAEQKLKDAKKEVLSSQKELEKGEKELENAQKDTTDQLAETSKLLDQAMATQSAFSAQVAGLEASKAALEMEYQAYTKGSGGNPSVLSIYNQVNEGFQKIYEMTTPGGAGYQELYDGIYAQLEPGIRNELYETAYRTTLSASLLRRINTLLEVENAKPDSAQKTENIQKLEEYRDLVQDGSSDLDVVLNAMVADGFLSETTDAAPMRQAADSYGRTAADLGTAGATATAASTAIAQMRANLPADIQDAVEHPEKLDYLKDLLDSMSQSGGTGSSIDLSGIDTSQLTAEKIKPLYDIVIVRIPQLETELKNIEMELLVSREVQKQVDESVKEASDNYAMVEAGKISAAIEFAKLQVEMAQGKTALESAMTQIEEGLESLETARETAIEQANLDALLSMDVLSKMILAQNFSMPAGYLYQGENQYLLKVGEEYDSLEQLEDSLLCTIEEVGDIRLKDVAYITVIDNAGESYARLDGEEAIILSIYKSSTAGTSDVSKAANKALKALEEKYEGLHLTPLMDQGDYIKMIVNEVLSNLIWGAVLAIIVLALFLKDFKPTIVVAFSIPISVLFAVVLMYFTDVTLNIISLSGLALGIGMLVDNSIVVIENIYRFRGEGIPAAKAAVRGANQVAGAIFASTLTTVCVFLPIVFTSGLTRQLFTDMALTIAYSLGASLIVALTLVPSMSATVLKNSKEKTHTFFDQVTKVYEKSLRLCIKRKVIPLFLAIGFLVFSIWQVTRMGMILIPEMGGNQMSVTASAPEDMSREEAYELADQLVEEFSHIQGVETVGAMSGGSGLGMLSGKSTKNVSFSFYILLDEEASKDNKKVAAQIEEIILENNLEGSVSTSNMDLSSLAGSGMTIRVHGRNSEQMIAVTEDMMEMLASIEGFDEISNGQEEGDPQIKVIVDKDKAMSLGLTVAQVYAELAARLTTETTSTTLNMGGEQWSVTIVDENDLVSLDNLMEQEFTIDKTTLEGEKETEVHQLKEFARMEEGKSLASISRENQSRYISVTASAKEGYNVTLLSRQVEPMLDRYEAPEGITIEITGESTSVKDAMSDMLLMIGLAIVFIYLIMVAQFQSLLSPFIVLFTIPLAFTGGLLALLISGEQLSMIAMMGFLVLAGVVVNNGIVFVDYANQLRLEGAERREALVETGKTRMRPILMTALTTILAMSTMAFSDDAAASMGKGMAIVTIGGLAYATLMTLYIIPVLYDMLFKKELKKVDIGEE